jgi:hypothetical protein
MIRKQLRKRILLSDQEIKSLKVHVSYRKMLRLLVQGLFPTDPLSVVGSEIPDIIQAYDKAASDLRYGNDAWEYYRHNQVAALLKKLEGVPFRGYDPQAAAVEGWLRSENVCENMNREYWDVKQSPITLAHTPLAKTIGVCRSEIQDLLGFEPPTPEEWLGYCKFGPGVSLSTKGDMLDPILKTVNPSSLESARGLTALLYEHTILGSAVFTAVTGSQKLPSKEELVRVCMEHTEFVDYAKLTTVPKNYATDRCIEIGASLATWLQQGVDGAVRRLLKLNWGLDLNNQEPNRRLCRLGSISGEFATIDMTSASDRISLGAVISLFPPAWAKLLFSLTNRRTVIHDSESPDGLEVLRLNKFSAMGNALTFSIQTAIFGAVVRSVLRERSLDADWRVYGDDIIVPTPIFDEVVYRLETLGFEINKAKSYSTGNFRESCGVDYLLGTNVRGFYIKKPIENVADVYKYLNLITYHTAGCPKRVRAFGPLYAYLMGTLPEVHKVFGPPTRALDCYIWAPQLKSFRHMPKEVLLRARPTEGLPPYWAYLRALLTGESGDSSIRDKRPKDRRTVMVGTHPWELTEAVPSHSRPSLAGRVEQWVYSRDTMSLGSLELPEVSINPFLV